MTRHLTVVWPDQRAFEGRNGEAIRLLAVSDKIDPVLEHSINREQLGRIDAIVGCGDLEPTYLGFLGDAFKVPVAYVRGNHDRGGHWAETVGKAPTHLTSGRLIQLGGVTVAAFEWPGLRPDRAARDEWTAWGDVIRAWRTLLVRRLFGRTTPVLVLSHAPPRGVGDHAANRYHLGYAAYRWLLEHLRPPLWLHGHVDPATITEWQTSLGPSIVANVTGSVIVDLVPPGATTGGDNRVTLATDAARSARRHRPSS